MTPGHSTKTCVVCGEDCSAKARTKDTKGRYFCKECYDRTIAQRSSAIRSATVSTPPVPHATAPPAADTYGLESEPARPIRTAPRPAPTSATAPQPVGHPDVVEDGEPLPCPSCDRTLSAGTRVCVPCGINVVTGRSIATAEQGDVEAMQEHARGIFWFVSLLMLGLGFLVLVSSRGTLWFASLFSLVGMFPISSEAHGTRKPWVLWSLALVTVITSMGMWFFEWTESPRMRVLKNQFLWAGDAEPDPEMIEQMYQLTSFGDADAFEDKKFELQSMVPGDQLAIMAMESLPASKQVLGQFHWWQLITHALLHDDFFHLAGNLLFMIVFGSRINALIGGLGTLIVYPILAIASALMQMSSMSHGPPGYLLGASGAIMGLAGMYFVFFPVSPVHVAAYARVPILLLGFFKCRGLWIILFYMSFDVLATLLQSEDGVAHWAHLGGFIAGMILAVFLLLARGVNARGNDLISVLLGRHAWALLGKPSQWQNMPEGEGWLTRAQLIPASVIDEIAATFRRDGDAPDQQQE